MCLYPRIIYNPKYTKTKKNGGVIPPIRDKRVLAVPAGCTKCMECRRKKQNEWTTRLLEDTKVHKNGHFVTLTFSNEKYTKLAEEKPELKGYALDYYIYVRAVDMFCNRWRKRFGNAPRHFFINELGHGTTEHLHIHGIIWTDKPKAIKELWLEGYSWTGHYYSERTVNYIVKYITKTDPQHKEFTPRILNSRGIGRNYTDSYNSTLNKYIPGKTKETYTDRSGRTRALPMYWRNKLYTEDEKESLWLEKLDKNERWVNGTKIDLNKPGGEEEYYRAIEQARKLNKEQGYGDDGKNWKRQKYEQQRRILKQNLRTNNKNKDLAPSAGSLALGPDLVIGPTKEQDYSPLDSGVHTVIKRTGVAPAVGCERLHQILERKFNKNVEN